MRISSISSPPRCVSPLVESTEDAVPQLQDGNVERPAAEIIDSNGSLLTFIQTVCERCCGWLVDDAQNVQAGDTSGILSRLALRVIEVRWNRNHCVLDLLT